MNVLFFKMAASFLKVPVGINDKPAVLDSQGTKKGRGVIS